MSTETGPSIKSGSSRLAGYLIVDPYPPKHVPFDSLHQPYTEDGRIIYTLVRHDSDISIASSVFSEHLKRLVSLEKLFRARSKSI